MVNGNAPIVVLDSGLGGLTVARALWSALPQDELIYFGDTARLPYGSKSPATVTTFVKQIITYLSRFNPKHVVIACNTATALALPAVRAAFPELSISGVVEPGAQAAVEATGQADYPIIGVIATDATIRSQAYERAIHKRKHSATILTQSAPLLVPIIEEGRPTSDPLVRLALQQYLKPLLDRNIQVLVLGCTHYPILQGLIEEMAGPSVRVIDSAERCAEDVQRRLKSTGLLRTNPNRMADFRCYVTDDSPRFAEIASRFMGIPVDQPTWIAPDQLTDIKVSDFPLRVVG